MPHDLNGTLLAKGDQVVIEGTVSAIQEGEEYCNLTIETNEPMFPSGAPSTIVLNAKQVTLCRRAETGE